MPSSLALQGALHTIIFNEGRHTEISIVQGENRYLTVGMQVLQTVQMLGLAALVAQAAGYNGISPSLKYAAIALPFTLGVASGVTPHASRFSPILATIHRNLGRFNLSASLAAGVALIHFGQPLAGSTVVSILALEILTEQGILPTKWRQRYRVTLYPVFVISSLFTGDWLNFINGLSECIMRALDISFRAMGIALSALFEPLKFRPYRLSRLTPEILKKVQNGSLKLKVNSNYVTRQVMPPIPDCDIEELVTQFDAINWRGSTREERRTLRALENKVRSDKRYKNHGAGQEPLTFARQQLVDYVYSVKHRQILEGEPRDYQLLEDYLKIATHALRTADDTTRSDALMRLAIDGGNYCGPAKFDAAEEEAFSLMSKMDTLSFIERMLLNLERHRASILQAIYPQAKITADGKTMALPDSMVDTLHDRHIFNLFINIMGTSFGVRRAGAENDTAFELPYILRRLAYFDLTMLGIIKDPWMKHTPQSITGYLGEIFGTDTLPKGEYYQLWQEWLESLEESEAKTELMDEFSRTYTINGRAPMVVRDQMDPNDLGKPDRALLLAMLYDIGILRKA